MKSHSLNTSVGKSAEEPGSERPALIYDAECRLCVAARERIEQLGTNQSVRYIPYQSEEAACRLGAAYKPDVRPDAAYLIDREGRITKGLDAFLPLLPGLRGGRMMLRLLRLPFGRPLAYLLYRIVAKNRYRWFGAVGD